MASRYDKSVKVPQSTIDEIKKLGMSDAIKKANSGGASREFVEGARRYYGGNRVSGTSPDRNESQSGSRGQGDSTNPSGNTVAESQNVIKTQPISSTKSKGSGLSSNLKAAAARRNKAKGSKEEYKSAPHRSGGRGRNPTKVLGDLGSSKNPKGIPQTVNRAAGNAAKAVGNFVSGGPDKSASETEAAYNKRLEALGGVKSRYKDYKEKGWSDKQLNYMLTDKERGKSESSKAAAAARRRKKS